MSVDPITRLAQQRIIKVSAELEVQISAVAGGGPAIEILRRLEKRAAESLAGLVFLNYCDPADVVKAQQLACEVKRYDEWFAAIGDILREGRQYDQEFTQKDREDLLQLLLDSGQEEQAVRLGLMDGDPRDA